MAEEAKEEEVEYESDPEETKLSLKMRRREASDDEGEDGGDGEEDSLKPRKRVVVDSDVESDSQGAAAEYEDEEEEYVEEEEDEEIIDEDEYVEELEEEEYDERMGEVGEVEVVAKVMAVEAQEEGRKENREDSVGIKSIEGLQGSNDDGHFGDGANENQEGEELVEEVEKKENEPYAVPTAGAFYMHDDRFRDNAGGRNRRTFGGRRLWESKDDKKWGHDKFEELTMQERHFDEGKRNSRGRYQGHGRNRGAERGGYVRGNRPRTYNNNNNQHKSSNQNNAPKSVRGRGPRRYQPAFKRNDEMPPALNQQSGKTAEKPLHSSSGRVSAPTSNVESDAAPAKKHVFASILNSASPPFYPSASTSKETALTQKTDIQPRTNNRRIHPSVMDESFSTAQSSAVQRGKCVVNSIGVDKLRINDSVATVAGKSSTTLQFPPGSSSMSSSQSLQLRAQGRGINTVPQMTYQPTGLNSQVNRISPATQLHTAQRNPVQNRGQPSLQASEQQFLQNPGGGSHVSSPKAGHKSSFESGETESSSDTNKSKAALVVKGKGSGQGTGRGSFLYGGAQVIGASGNPGTGGPGDQNFPAFLPVMQFAGQHPGGIGVPAVGMAFPGYVGQPQLGGLGNSEMTWLPVLAGAAGALGATYCSPYLSMDGSYHARPSGQASSLAGASIKENNADKPNNLTHSFPFPDVANDDCVQRQKNPRRYTEMKFDQ
ncbi:hypothetical protein ACH5RR_008122 [Cinchona calisaya]|uniref:Btz domain-containing protein n=1 Tax=Cinchona calisaya TaxID=153742 RepID=A0ABD3AAG0_9GENT